MKRVYITRPQHFDAARVIIAASKLMFYITSLGRATSGNLRMAGRELDSQSCSPENTERPQYTAEGSLSKGSATGSRRQCVGSLEPPSSPSCGRPAPIGGCSPSNCCWPSECLDSWPGCGAKFRFRPGRFVRSVRGTWSPMRTGGLLRKDREPECCCWNLPIVARRWSTRQLRQPRAAQSARRKWTSKRTMPSVMMLKRLLRDAKGRR